MLPTPCEVGCLRAQNLTGLGITLGSLESHTSIGRTGERDRVRLREVESSFLCYCTSNNIEIYVALCSEQVRCSFFFPPPTHPLAAHPIPHAGTD